MHVRNLIVDRRSERELDHRGTRRGVMMIEVIVAAVILGVAIAMLLPGMTAVRKQRLAMRFESLAIVEIRNQIALRTMPRQPRDESTVEQSSEPVLSGWFVERYPNARLDVQTVSDPAASVDDVQPVRYTIHRASTDAMPDQAVSLVVWMLSGPSAAEPQP